MSKRQFFKETIRLALSLLPAKLNTELACKYLLAIGYQESKFIRRTQISGPAIGYWQFELPTIDLVYQKAEQSLGFIMNFLDIPTRDIYTAFKYNEILQAAFARWLLYFDPSPLVPIEQLEESWNIYLSAWRPGKPRKDAWELSVKFSLEAFDEPDKL